LFKEFFIIILFMISTQGV